MPARIISFRKWPRNSKSSGVDTIALINCKHATYKISNTINLIICNIVVDNCVYNINELIYIYIQKLQYIILPKLLCLPTK